MATRAQQALAKEVRAALSGAGFRATRIQTGGWGEHRNAGGRVRGYEVVPHPTQADAVVVAWRGRMLDSTLAPVLRTFPKYRDTLTRAGFAVVTDLPAGGPYTLTITRQE